MSTSLTLNRPPFAIPGVLIHIKPATLRLRWVAFVLRQQVGSDTRKATERLFRDDFDVYGTVRQLARACADGDDRAFGLFEAVLEERMEVFAEYVRVRYGLAGAEPLFAKDALHTAAMQQWAYEQDKRYLERRENRAEELASLIL